MDRIQRFNENTKNIVIPQKDNRAKNFNIDDDSTEPENDSIQIPKAKTRKNLILDSYVEEPVVVVKPRKNKIDSDSDDGIILIDEPKKIQRPPLVKQKNFNHSEDIIEITEEPKKTTAINNNNSNKIQEEIKLDDTDDEEFNQWLVNNTFSEKSKPKEPELPAKISPEKVVAVVKPYNPKDDSAQSSVYFKSNSSLTSNFDVKMKQSNNEVVPRNLTSSKLEQSKTTATNTTLSNSTTISNISTIEVSWSNFTL